MSTRAAPKTNAGVREFKRDMRSYLNKSAVHARNLQQLGGRKTRGRQPQVHSFSDTISAVVSQQSSMLRTFLHGGRKLADSWGRFPGRKNQVAPAPRPTPGKKHIKGWFDHVESLVHEGRRTRTSGLASPCRHRLDRRCSSTSPVKKHTASPRCSSAATRMFWTMRAASSSCRTATSRTKQGMCFSTSTRRLRPLATRCAASPPGLPTTAKGSAHLKRQKRRGSCHAPPPPNRATFGRPSKAAGIRCMRQPRLNRHLTPRLRGESVWRRGAPARHHQCAGHLTLRLLRQLGRRRHFQRDCALPLNGHRSLLPLPDPGEGCGRIWRWHKHPHASKLAAVLPRK